MNNGNDPISAAQMRIRHALPILKKLARGGYMLDDVAQAVVQVEGARSAVNLIYDELYRANLLHGTMEYQRQCPLGEEPPQ